MSNLDNVDYGFGYTADANLGGDLGKNVATTFLTEAGPK